MKLITISEFKRLSGLPDAALIWILSNNLVKCQLDEEKGILIDVDSSDLQMLVEAIAVRMEDSLLERKTLIREHFARIISDNLDEILNEAISLSQRDA